MIQTGPSTVRAGSSAKRLGAVLAMGVVALVLAASAAHAQQTAPQREWTVREAIRDSLFGDVYADPSRWRPLSLGSFFTEGWDAPWVSPPNGSGGAPRQGWLNAFDGVFYRLNVSTFGYAHNFNDNGNQYTGLTQFYLPFNQRFEWRFDVPIVTSNRGGPNNDYRTNFGDFQITPRFLLSESQDVTQSFNMTIRIPSGRAVNGNDVTSVTPDYEFWANWWRGLVVRGGVGMTIPDHDTGVRTTFIANLAPGYYFTSHDLAPFGDLVGYVSANLSQYTDNNGPSNTTTVTLTPGFRDYLGWNWYLLGGVVVPVTHPKPFDYQILGALMFVF
jgi:hypothetical protein